MIRVFVNGVMVRGSLVCTLLSVTVKSRSSVVSSVKERLDGVKRLCFVMYAVSLSLTYESSSLFNANVSFIVSVSVSNAVNTTSFK